MYKVNLSEGIAYHSQKNNEFIPFASCGPTSAIMSLKAAKIPFYAPVVMQPEDYLTANLTDKEAWELFEKDFPGAVKHRLWPNNISHMLQWGINKMVGRKVDVFKKSGSLREMIWHLVNRRPLIVSGRFTKSGHFVSVVGFESYQPIGSIRRISDVKLADVEYIIVDDPYGKYPYTDKKPSGNDTHFTLQEFNGLTNASGIENKKWLHIFSNFDWRMEL